MMGNFDVDLERLISEWRKRGADLQSMKDALDEASAHLWSVIKAKRELQQQ